MTNIDFDNLEKMIAGKYISRQKHPTLDLYIHNYTQRCQFDRVWNNETLQCRGLIMDGQNNIVSRPFPKFFNFGELVDGLGYDLEEEMQGDFTVTEKMDGSLGISYFDPQGKMHIATRGSFVSDQAKRAEKIIKNSEFNNDTEARANPEHTYLFEIIYPENRIVVDYGRKEELVLLSIIETKTDKELDYNSVKKIGERFGHTVVPRFYGITDFNKIEQKPNAEGYVVHFPSTGLRFKVKFDEYVRLHKIITGINAKRVWEFLKEGQELDPLLERVPDEFFQWINKTKADLVLKYSEIELEAVGVWAKARYLPTRKEQALFILKQEIAIPGVVFNMLDGKPYDQIIWKQIEPEFEAPFKVEI